MSSEARIAVATSNGRDVNEHFGRADSFHIYMLRDGTYRLLERRWNDPPCSGGYHNDDLLERTADLLEDCQAVVACQIGPGAIDLLLSRGILPLPMEGPVVEALGTLRHSKFLVTQ